MEKTKNEKSFIILVIITLLMVSLCIGEAFAAKATKKDFIGNWEPVDPTGNNPSLQANDGGNNLLNLTRYWNEGLASHEGSRIELSCEYDGKDILACNGKKYEYYPIRNGKRISSLNMTEEEAMDENFPTKESLVDVQIYVKYKLEKHKIKLQKNPLTNKLQIKFNYITLYVVDASEIEGDLWVPFVKIKEYK